jgi:4-hydroxy-tetrahydrodipicolinate synthase
MLSGSIVALVTPLHNNSVDLMALESLIKWHLESGTDGILVCGSTGEGMLLSEDERASIINTAAEILAKRIPLIVGCGDVAAGPAAMQVKKAEECGANYALVTVPYYLKPTQSGINQHFIDIHNSTKLPLVLYNNPSRCAVNVNVDTIVNLYANTRIVAIKDSDVNLSRVVKLKSQARDLAVLCGDDASLVGFLASGGDGAISVISNIAPSQTAEMIRCFKSGDMKRVNALNIQLTYLSEALFVETNPIPVKYALYVKGMIDNELKKPLTKASDITKNIIESVTGKWNFF